MYSFGQLQLNRELEYNGEDMSQFRDYWAKAYCYNIYFPFKEQQGNGSNVPDYTV